MPPRGEGRLGSLAILTDTFTNVTVHSVVCSFALM